MSQKKRLKKKMTEQGWSWTGWQDWGQTGWQDWSQQNWWQQQDWQQGYQQPQQAPDSVRIWYDTADHHAIQRDIFRHGLPCRLEFEIYGDYWVLQVIPEEGFQHLAVNLPQFFEERHGKPYHITICSVQEALPFQYRIDHIRKKWDGKEVTLKCIGWSNPGQETSNGANCLIGGKVGEDPDIQFLHATHKHAHRPLHISF
jgi:hypothetical protein